MLNGAGTQSQRELVIVDDDSMVHERIKRYLRRTPWSAVCFLDPEEALAYLQVHTTFDLLFVDNRMPRMDGMDLVDRLGWPLAMMSDRVYLCSTVHPPGTICAHAERRGVKVLCKDAFLEREELLSLLANVDAHAKAVG